MKRRPLLAIGGSLVTSTVAGCIDHVPTVGATTLGGVGIVNYDAERSHQFDVRIERDGTVVHQSSHQLAADDDQARDPPQVGISCTWDRTAGEYTVFIRSDEREWERFDPLNRTAMPPDCVVVETLYGDDFGPSDDPPTFTFQVEEDCPGSECFQSKESRE